MSCSDMKEGLSSSRKVGMSHVRGPLKTYIARACEYGSAKYQRGNFLRPTLCLREDFERLRLYLEAAERHITAVFDAMEAHLALDPELQDEIGMKRAAYAEDFDEDTSGKAGPSGLPHLCGLAASINMAITQAARSGLIPMDPGQPWARRRAPESADVEQKREPAPDPALPCTVYTPPGFAPCTRTAGHDGPCAHPLAVDNSWLDRFGDGGAAVEADPVATRIALGMDSPLVCDHANECPAECKCGSSCSCQRPGNTCERLKLTVKQRNAVLEGAMTINEAAREALDECVALYDDQHEPICKTHDVPLDETAHRRKGGPFYKCRLTGREVPL